MNPNKQLIKTLKNPTAKNLAHLVIDKLFEAEPIKEEKIKSNYTKKKFTSDQVIFDSTNNPKIETAEKIVFGKVERVG